MLQQFISQSSGEGLIKLEPERTPSAQQSQSAGEFGAFLNSAHTAVTNQSGSNNSTTRYSRTDSASHKDASTSQSQKSDSHSARPSNEERVNNEIDRKEESADSHCNSAVCDKESQHSLYGYPDSLERDISLERENSPERNSCANGNAIDPDVPHIDELKATDEETDWLDFVEGVIAFTEGESKLSDESELQTTSIEESSGENALQGLIAVTETDQNEALPLKEDELSDALTESQVKQLTQALWQALAGDQSGLEALSDEDKQLLSQLAQLDASNVDEAAAANSELELSGAQALQALHNLASITEQSIAELSADNINTDFIAENRSLSVESLAESLNLTTEDTVLLLDMVAEKLANLTNSSVTGSDTEKGADSSLLDNMSVSELANLAALLLVAENEAGQDGMLSADAELNPDTEFTTSALVANSLAATSARIMAQNGKANKAPEGETTQLDALKAEQVAMNELMKRLAELPESSRQKINESVADKIVASVPNLTTETQQTLKANITAGLNEIQAQLMQGRVAGINVQDMVEQSVAQAGVNIDPAQLQATIDQQVQRLGALVSTAQHALNLLDGQGQTATHFDTSQQENNQIKIEQGRSLQGLTDDKPVNIANNEGRQQLAEKIRWIVNSRSNIAEIRLDPPDLGTVQVRVNVSGETASVSFLVQSVQAKEALADATGRLRDMLAQQGIDLGESFVQQEFAQGDTQNGEGDGNQRGAGSAGHGMSGPDIDDDTHVIEQAVTRTMQGGIDAYA